MNIDFRVCRCDCVNDEKMEREEELKEFLRRAYLAMNPHCSLCVYTKFRAGVACGEWAKMNAVLNGQDWDIACPMYQFFKEITGTE